MSNCKEPKFYLNDINDTNDAKFWLVKYSDDWADECQFYGFCFMTNIELIEWKNTIDNVFSTCGSLYMGFGTNESNEYDKKSDLERTLKTTSITEQDYNTLNTIFRKPYGKGNVYGHFPDIERLKDLLDDAEWEKAYGDENA